MQPRQEVGATDQGTQKVGRGRPVILPCACLDYRGEPVPPLAADDQQWTDELLRAAKVR